MATFYVDFENGNDGNNGTTFAQRWKTLTNGATAARIAPGDEIRIMGSPAPTSLGQNGVWTSSALQGTKNITGTTNTTPISVTCTAHGYSTGDTVVITGVTPHFAANGTWEITVTGPNTFTLDASIGNATSATSGTVRLRNNTRVKLTTAVTQNIASTGPARAAWVASSNCSHSFSGTIFKEHDSSDAITVNSAFTTGKAAYYTLPTTLDLSAYQQVSFWVHITFNAFTTANKCELRLCSDTTGDTVVNTIAFPVVPSTGRWQCVTVDKGSALGSSISSIALHVNEDLANTGNVIVYLNNIIACKASSEPDSLTLTSLIGKNVSGETFWGIQSINGTRVMLDSDTNIAPNSSSVRGYYGTSETVTTWKRETIKLGPPASANNSVEFIQDSGTGDQFITYSGGWDRVNMSTQNGETWIDGQNGLGRAIENARQFTLVKTIAFIRFSVALRLTTAANHQYYDVVAMNNCGTPVNQLGGASFSITIGSSAANTNWGVELFNSRDSITVTGSIVSNTAGGIRLASNGCKLLGTSSHLIIGNNNGYGVAIDGFGYAEGIKTGDNASGGFTTDSLHWFKNCSSTETLEVVPDQLSDNYVYSHNHDQVDGNHKIFIGDGLISAATDQRRTASGISWKMQPLNSTNRFSGRPIILSLAKVAVTANSLVTVKAWMRRDNSGLTMRLVCKGGQIAGVDNDVTASVTTTNAWEEETITFTPTETGVVEITAEAWGGSTFSGWVDDLTISQA